MQANDMSKAIETLTLQILVLDLHNFDALKKRKILYYICCFFPRAKFISKELTYGWLEVFIRLSLGCKKRDLSGKAFTVGKTC